MRVTALLLALFTASAASAQPAPCQNQGSTSVERLGFDPYSPGDLAIIRNYGGAVLSQASIDTLMRLDPYVPSEGALLRQAGGGLPFWSYGPYGWFGPPPPSAPCRESNVAADRAAETPFTLPFSTFQDVFARLQQETGAGESTSSNVAVNRTSGAETREPARGITIDYDGRVWTPAGKAVRHNENEFNRVGERAGLPVYARVDAGTSTRAARRSQPQPATRASEDARVIYVPTLPGLVAPFRVVR